MASSDRREVCLGEKVYAAFADRYAENAETKVRSN